LLAASGLKAKTTLTSLSSGLKNHQDRAQPSLRLEDAVYGERRRAKEAALKTEKTIPLGFLTPSDEKAL
jgi:hypothetical protein